MNQEGGSEVRKDCAIEEKATIFKYSPNQKEKNDLLLTLAGKEEMILKRLEKQLQKHRGIKWYLSSQLRMVKASPDGEDQVSTPHFRSVCQTTTYPTQLNNTWRQRKK